MHLCTENPCPIQDIERLKFLENGYKTTYSMSVYISTNETCSILKKELKKIDKGVFVRHGTGTAYAWIEVVTDIPRVKVLEIVDDLEERGLIYISKYPDDMTNEMHDCLSVKPKQNKK